MKTIHANSERFEVSFNRIHQNLKQLLKNEKPQFTNLVYKGSRKFSLVRTYQQELIQFAKLRNAIVHEQYQVGEYIAEPHESTVEKIEKIAKLFSKPEYALTIATKNVVSYECEDSIEEVIQGINRFSYSQYPVYQSGNCIGLLTARAVVKWMAEHIAGSTVDLAEIKVIDICRHEQQHPLAFTAKTSNLFDVEEIFEEAHQAKKDLEAVIVTENGKSKEAPLGIITPWDLIEIDYRVNGTD